MTTKITVAGNMIADTVKKIDSYPVRGTLSSILEISHGVGGMGCSTSIALAKLDKSFSITAIGRIGDDENGAYVRKSLINGGVNPNVIIDDSLPTSFTDVMSDQHGDRTFFHARGANAALCYDDIPYDKLDCELFHIGYILLLDSMDAEDDEYGTKLARTLARVRSMGIKTSVDVVSENSDRFSRVAIPSLKYCDYIIINDNEASLITGLPAREENGELSEIKIRRILERLFELGVNEMVSVHTSQGGWALSRTAGFAYSPSLDLPEQVIKGHVGAGDAFSAGMLYSMCKGFDLKYALEIAAGTAACSLTEANTTDGLRDFNGVLDMINQWGFNCVT